MHSSEIKVGDLVKFADEVIQNNGKFFQGGRMWSPTHEHFGLVLECKNLSMVMVDKVRVVVKVKWNKPFDMPDGENKYILSFYQDSLVKL